MATSNVTIDMYRQNNEECESVNQTTTNPTSSEDLEVQSSSALIDNDDSHSSSSSSSGEPECTICMAPLSQQPEGEDVTQGTRTLACGHTFHTHCIETWLLRNNLCPLCRAEVPGTGRPRLIERPRTIPIGTVIRSLQPDMKHIFTRQLITLAIAPGAYIYEISTFTYISSYALMLLFFLTLLSIGIIIPFVKGSDAITSYTIMRTREVFGNLPFIRIITLTMFMSSRVLEIGTLNPSAYVAVIATCLSLGDDFLINSALSPAGFSIRLHE